MVRLSQRNREAFAAALPTYADNWAHAARAVDNALGRIGVCRGVEHYRQIHETETADGNRLDTGHALHNTCRTCQKEIGGALPEFGNTLHVRLYQMQSGRIEVVAYIS